MAAASGLLYAAGGTAAQAESIEGVLEQSGAHSALFTVSPESGDLIGYPFKNNSPVGKTILANCLPGLVCKKGKVSIRNMEDASALKFKDNPSGWLEITRAADVNMTSAITQYEKTIKTCYGILSISPDTNTLQFKGKPVLPNIEGNNGLSIVRSYEIGKDNVVLLQNNGGTACPALYVFVKTNAAGLRATPEFGTCSGIIYPTSDLKNSVTVAMNGFMGPFNTTVEQRKAGMTKTVFRYADGSVSKN